ncbi:unnamed protein product [Phytomonas sp. Hart1]|nr:unnamed protein product [Phytomonas sp. Hart1]|eukprot:CCW70168.1 unnamed protein product [Phytomonas sp. isolate Hart1]
MRYKKKKRKTTVQDSRRLLSIRKKNPFTKTYE